MTSSLLKRQDVHPFDTHTLREIVLSTTETLLAIARFYRHNLNVLVWDLSIKHI